MLCLFKSNDTRLQIMYMGAIMSIAIDILNKEKEAIQLSLKTENHDEFFRIKQFEMINEIETAIKWLKFVEAYKLDKPNKYDVEVLPCIENSGVSYRMMIDMETDDPAWWREYILPSQEEGNVITGGDIILIRK